MNMILKNVGKCFFENDFLLFLLDHALGSRNSDAILPSEHMPFKQSNVKQSRSR